MQGLSPASREVRLAPGHTSAVKRGWEDGSLAVRQVEEQHGVLVQLQHEVHCVRVAGLTLKDVEAAMRHITTYAESMATFKEDVLLPVEQFYFLRAKRDAEMRQVPCAVTFIDGTAPRVSLDGRRDAIAFAKSVVFQQLSNFVAVHVTVQYPSLLHDFLEVQWQNLCKNTGLQANIVCLRQQEPFPVSNQTPLTTIDCSAYLQFPSTMAPMGRCMSFLVAGTAKDQFTAILQQLRATSSCFVAQQVQLTPAQRMTLDRRLKSGAKLPLAAVYLEQSTIHIFSPSPAELQISHQELLKWLDDESATETVSVNNHNVKKFVEKELAGAATSVAKEFRVKVHVNQEGTVMEAVLTGADQAVLRAKEELQSRWRRIEGTVATKYIPVRHHLVPVLRQKATKDRIEELERQFDVACTLTDTTLQAYEEEVKTHVGKKLSPSTSDMNPLPFNWPVCGKDAKSIGQAIDNLRLLLDVSLDERELCVAGVAEENAAAALSKLAGQHLVEVSVRSDQSGYRDQSSAWTGLFQASLQVTVRGLAPRPLAALQQLQIDLDL